MANNAAQTPKKKKKWGMPHTYIILFGIVLIVSLLTYVIPAGQFERVEDPDSGRSLIVAGSYQEVESSPVSPLSIPLKFVQTLSKPEISEIIFFIFIIGGAFELIMRTGMIAAFCGKLGRAFRGKEKLIIPIFVALFATGGFTMGMSVEVLVFVPIGIAVAKAVGYDAITGTSMIAMGSIVGFTAGIYNPFNVGVAQSIAGIPLFSGAWYRWIILIVLVIATSLYIIHYAEKVKRDPSKNILNGVDMGDSGADVEIPEVNFRHVLILLTVVAGFALLIYGVSSLGWFIAEMAVIFLVMGVVCGLLAGFGPNKVCDIFVEGAGSIAYGALIIGVAGTIQTVMADGLIIDTIINAFAQAIMALPKAVQVLGMYCMQTIINLPINSGTGQAAATMPIMAPVGDLVGVSRQTTVLAFQLGDGFTNAIFPTSSTMLGFLAASKIPYAKWLKYVLPLMAILFVLGGIFVMVAPAIGY
ncbi:YfcC family protein [Bittarella massiliensis (ex Durand et al. 2017)]|uniref:YfcC family protein n=1 Tax=Bittarella massiliensis (ex Durand et al. 2017) TaxID=1720313 RepID=UPI001AA1AFF1|nr:AbgT family transporter [Bittarella massiliensis (ex Durand et al. 2017)]MBO1679051.1 YfcC family protein [Bittarella massiliensis (ex Durand et al. 2017)]